MSRSSAVFLAIFALCITGGILWLVSQKSVQPEKSLNVKVIREEILDSLHSKGADATYAHFKKTYDSAEFDIQHNIAHIFGESLYDVFGARGVQTCDADFNFGCYHGFFTRIVSVEGLSVIPKLDLSCSESLRASACQHGIGHGILEYMGNTHLEDALRACKKTHQPDPLAGCTSGVFMEYNVPLSVGNDGMFTLETRPLENVDEPYHPCTEVSSEFRLSCYHELPQWWMQVYDADFETMGRFCVEAGDASGACLAGLGNVVASYAKYEPEATANLCARMPNAGSRRACIVNAAWSFETDAESHTDAVKLCNYLSSEERTECLQ